MKTLEEQFTKHGFLHRQVVREGDLVIYERSKVEVAPHFEVVKIGRHNGYTLGRAFIPPAETYPTAEQWGKKAWTYNDSEAAWVKFRELMAVSVA